MRSLEIRAELTVFGQGSPILAGDQLDPLKDQHSVVQAHVLCFEDRVAAEDGEDMVNASIAKMLI